MFGASGRARSSRMAARIVGGSAPASCHSRINAVLRMMSAGLAWRTPAARAASEAMAKTSGMGTSRLIARPPAPALTSSSFFSCGGGGGGDASFDISFDGACLLFSNALRSRYSREMRPFRRDLSITQRYSLRRRFCCQPASDSDQKAITTGFNDAHFLGPIPSMVPMRRSSSGSAQSGDRHAMSISLNYAPCPSSVRCCVSAR